MSRKKYHILFTFRFRFIEIKKILKKSVKLKLKCRNCGHIVESIEAPEQCPMCAHPREYFELFVENY